MKDERGLKFGRIDCKAYFLKLQSSCILKESLDNQNSYKLCTRWFLFTIPQYVIISEKGKQLWFFSPFELKPSVENVKDIMLNRLYMNLSPWNSSFSYNGK